MNSVLQEIQQHAATLPLALQAELLNYTIYLESKVHGGANLTTKAQQRERLAEALEQAAALNPLGDIAEVEWNRDEFSQLAMNQAMRGMEDEPPLYTLDDLKERWR